VDKRQPLADAGTGKIDATRIQVFALDTNVVTPASGASDNLILWSRRFATFSNHQPIKRGEIRALPALGEEGRRVHGRQLFGNCGCYELIDADAIGLGAALDFRFH